MPKKIESEDWYNESSTYFPLGYMLVAEGDKSYWVLEDDSEIRQN